jgi:hypothetical protein
VRTARNVAIILALAAVVDLVPGGGATAQTIMVAISMAFFAAITWTLFRLYNERQMTLMGIPDRRRAMLYGGVGGILLLIVGFEEFDDLQGGLFVWIALMTVAIGAIFVVLRDAARYS